MLEMIVSWDHQIASAIYSLRTPNLTLFFRDFTSLGSSAVTFSLTVVLSLLLLAAKKYRLVLQLTLAVCGGGIFFNVLKSIFARDRPDLVYRLMSVDGFSFPSGHSVNAATFWFTVALMACCRIKTLRKIVLGVATLLILLIGFSRIYLGVHYPTDVFAGLVMGTAFAFALHLAIKRERPSA